MISVISRRLINLDKADNWDLEFLSDLSGKDSGEMGRLSNVQALRFVSISGGEHIVTK
jgi:hypothetical protein